MKSKILSILLLVTIVSANRCINNHCSKQESQCKADTSSLPCHNIINSCLDYCSNNKSYACISLCVASRKNDLANKLVSCCEQFSCGIQKIVTNGAVSHGQALAFE